MIISENERRIYQSVIKKLIFTPCISQAEFIGMVVEQELGVQSYDDLLSTQVEVDSYGYGDSYEYEYNRAGKKVKRLLSYLICDSVNKKSLSEMIKMPKKYDNTMRTWQIKLYNSMIMEINNSTRTGVKFPLIDHMFSEADIIEQLGEDGVVENKEILSDAYPYLCFDTRSGFNYIECIFLINIILSHHQGSLHQLSQLTEHAADEKIAERWVEKVVSNMHSDNVCRLYIDTYFDKLYNLIVEEYNPVAEDFVKLAWLPPKYQNRKDAFNAAKKHGEWQGDVMFEMSESKQQGEFMHKLETTQELELLATEIVPSAWDDMIQKYKIKKELEYDDLRKEQGVELYSQKHTEACKHIAGKCISESVDAAQKMIEYFLIYS